MHKNSYKKLMPYRWKDDSSIKATDIVWREDMDTFVLEILRSNLAKKLAYLASRPAAYMAACRDSDQISKQNQVGAVLWLGPGEEQQQQHEGGLAYETAEGTGPPPYAMYFYRSHHIPVYNLPRLLGAHHLNTLKNGKAGHLGHQYAVLKAKNGTKDVQMELWKLLCYLVDNEQFVNSPDGVTKLPDSSNIVDECSEESEYSQK